MQQIFGCECKISRLTTRSKSPNYRHQKKTAELLTQPSSADKTTVSS